MYPLYSYWYCSMNIERSMGLLFLLPHAFSSCRIRSHYFHIPTFSFFSSNPGHLSASIIPTSHQKPKFAKQSWAVRAWAFWSILAHNPQRIVLGLSSVCETLSFFRCISFGNVWCPIRDTSRALVYYLYLALVGTIFPKGLEVLLTMTAAPLCRLLAAYSQL